MGGVGFAVDVEGESLGQLLYQGVREDGEELVGGGVGRKCIAVVDQGFS